MRSLIAIAISFVVAGELHAQPLIYPGGYRGGGISVNVGRGYSYPAFGPGVPVYQSPPIAYGYPGVSYGAPVFNGNCTGGNGGWYQYAAPPRVYEQRFFFNGGQEYGAPPGYAANSAGAFGNPGAEFAELNETIRRLQSRIRQLDGGR
jgi:hypothetical protein